MYLSRVRVLGAEVGDGGEAGEGALDQLEAVRPVEDAVVHLIQIGAAEVDQPLRLGALGAFVEVEVRVAPLHQQHEKHRLPLFVLLALFAQKALHFDS